MRLRHANIRLINRRSNLPRLLLALSSINGQCNDNSKNNPTDAQGLTGHSISDLNRLRDFQYCFEPDLWVDYKFFIDLFAWNLTVCSVFSARHGATVRVDRATSWVLPHY
jgi:hypothetical protein